MKLVFDNPGKIESLEIMLATKAYEDIWRQDHKKILELFKKYTGLQFQQDEIHVIVHDGQSMSGMDGKPMRLNWHNRPLVEKRNALVHELAHRLLFGNGLYAPESEGPDGDEIRVFLFQGDVLMDLYGEEVYSFWANSDPATQTEDHIRIINSVIHLSKKRRRGKIKQFVASGSNSDLQATKKLE